MQKKIFYPILYISLTLSSISTADTGTVSAVTTTTAAKANQPYCREYTQTFKVDNKIQNGYGTACLQPDGSWAIQKVPTAKLPTYGQVAIEDRPVMYVEKNGYPYLVPLDPYPYHGHIIVGTRDRRR
jgi:hypothetical protein